MEYPTSHSHLSSHLPAATCGKLFCNFWMFLLESCQNWEHFHGNFWKLGRNQSLTTGYEFETGFEAQKLLLNDLKIYLESFWSCNVHIVHHFGFLHRLTSMINITHGTQSLVWLFIKCNLPFLFSSSASLPITMFGVRRCPFQECLPSSIGIQYPTKCLDVRPISFKCQLIFF